MDYKMESAWKPAREKQFCMVQTEFRSINEQSDMMTPLYPANSYTTCMGRGNQALVILQDASVEKKCLERESIKQAPEKLAADFVQLTNLKQIDPNSLVYTYLKLQMQNKLLESSLEIKEAAMANLHSVNSSLKERLAHNNIMRLSQLEILALRNVELEREISKNESRSSNTSRSSSSSSSSGSSS